ncbi:hypothetical protein HPULCUR_003384 [Helicostylum pulchrum]|uniref:Uncharacterized protein n=1 Tax=Helicostylum pulchrum TaxID=562976 RepID=A0ABP9XT94_9FUNG
MSTTTQFTLDKFKFHLELYNRYQDLGEVDIDIQDDRKYLDLPQQNQVINSADIDVEDVLSKSPVMVNNTTMSQYQNAFNLHAGKSDQLQKFYSSKERAIVDIKRDSKT